MTRMPAREEVPVWDLFVRVYHWSQAALIAAAWITADEMKSPHEVIGHGVAGLVGLRLIWGLIGSPHARFSDFAAGPRTVAIYLRDLLRGRARRQLGHNPAGAAMILALWAVILLTGLTGWLQTTDLFWGSSLMHGLHEILANLILVLVSVHLAGVLLESRLHRENLILSMFTGTKPAMAPEAAPERAKGKTC